MEELLVMGGGASQGVASCSVDAWVVFCVCFPHSLVFPDSYLEIRSELVSAFFRCEACQVPEGPVEAGESREGQVQGFRTSRATTRRREHGAVCAAAITGTPEGLGGSCHSVLPSGRFSGDSTPRG